MTGHLRLALVIVGLGVVLYGIAALTGGWLGFPPRYEVITPPAIEADGEGGWVTYAAVLRDGGEATGIGLIVVGVFIIAVGAWPPSPTRGAEA